MFMRVNALDCKVTVNGSAVHAETVTALLTEIAKAMAMAASTASAEVTLPSRDGALTRGVYRVLGLRAPVPTRRLTLYSDGQRVLVAYEEDDCEWVSAGPPQGESAYLRTEKGEPFVAPASDCIDLEKAVEIMKGFLGTGRRPDGQWRRS